MYGLVDSFFQETTRFGGLTHAYYRYPATTSPLIVRRLLAEFTSPGDWVIDPFMGGGTTIVEALAAGRYALGADLNPVAVLVTRAKTTHLSPRAWNNLAKWATGFDGPLSASMWSTGDKRLRNFPEELRRVFGSVLTSLTQLPPGGQRVVARCALLQAAQWAVEPHAVPPTVDVLIQKLRDIIAEMRRGAQELAEWIKRQGGSPSLISQRRSIVCSPAAALADSRAALAMDRPARLVLCSPPYPGVHVLYHRWQVNGRRETPAAYWLARRRDGHGPAYYTMGGRSAQGSMRYFQELTATFRSLRPLLAPDALVVQIAGFANMEAQYPLFMAAMADAGFRPASVPWSQSDSFRVVPHRRWYTSNRSSDSAIEMLIAHTKDA